MMTHSLRGAFCSIAIVVATPPTPLSILPHHPPTPHDQGSLKDDLALMETILAGVDFKGGDLRGVGPRTVGSWKVGAFLSRG